jgi:hypothetical protein
MTLHTCGDPFQQGHLARPRGIARLYPLPDPLLDISLILLLALTACKTTTSRHPGSLFWKFSIAEKARLAQQVIYLRGSDPLLV